MVDSGRIYAMFDWNSPDSLHTWIVVFVLLGLIITGAAKLILGERQELHRKRYLLNVVTGSLVVIGLAELVLVQREWHLNKREKEQLEEQVHRKAPRVLLGDDSDKFIRVLKEYPPCSVTVSVIAGDSEAFGFAMLLAAALETAAWRIDKVYQTNDPMDMGRGVTVHTREERGCSAILKRGLRETGTIVTTRIDPTLPEDYLRLHSGGHPYR